MPLIGDTVLLTFYFEDENGVTMDVADATLKFYDSKKVQIGSTINLEDGYKDAPGVYKYNYVIPNGSGPITVEFSGIHMSKTYLNRQDIERVWVGSSGASYL